MKELISSALRLVSLVMVLIAAKHIRAVEPDWLISTVLTTERSDSITDAKLVDGGVVLAMTHGTVSIDENGRALSTVRYGDDRRFFPVRFGHDSPDSGILLAQDSNSEQLFVLGADGRIFTTLPAGYAADSATLMSDSGLSIAIEVPRRKAIAFFDLRGRRTGAAQLPFYISAMQSEGNSVLVAAYPNKRRGTTMYRVGSDGSVKGLHELHAVGDFTLLGGDRYAVIAKDDAIEIRDRSGGAVRRRIVAPGVRKFRDIHAAELPNGDIVFALSGRGGVDRHRVVWADINDRVLYTEESPTHAWAVLPFNGCAALVALENRMVRIAPAGCGPAADR